MADTKVSALTPASTVGLSDLLLLVQGGNSLKLDIETLLLNAPSRLIVKEASEALLVAGALATNKLTSKIKTLTAGVAYTLAAGTHGMEKVIVCDAADVTTPTGTLTVASGAGFTTVDFTTVGGSVHLKNVDGVWYVIGSYGVVIA